MTFDKSSLASGTILAVVVSLLGFASACGGGSHSNSSSSIGSSAPLSTTCSSSTGNCATLTTDNGLANGYVDGAFTTVKVCVPGNSSSCATVSGVLVDTGSVGLRLLKSTVSSIALPQATISGGSLVECYPFVDSFLWGPVATATIQIAGETASGAPIMLIDDSATPAFAVPSDCSDFGGTSLPSANSQVLLGANGILGIGSTQQDCGPGCALPVSQQLDGSGQFIGLYYNCASSSSCAGTAETVAFQVPQPVSQFATDNNGTAISLPSVPAAGSATVTGALYFGIGTQSNNPMPSTAAVLTLDTAFEQFITTTYKSTTNTHSFIDSGSNGYFFVDSTIPACTDTTSDPFASDWFCPTSTLALSATNSGSTGSSGSSTVSFSVANRDTLFSSPDSAFSDLGGPGTTNTFDWGLPFFFGRVVYNAIELKSAPNAGGTSFAGPFVAY
jgi:hypothetical protein